MIKRREYDAEHSLPPSVNVKNTRIYTSTAPYTFKH